MHATPSFARSLPLLLAGAVAVAASDLAAQGGGGAPRVEDGAVVGEVPYRLPPYDSLAEDVRGNLDAATDRARYERVRRDPRFVLRKLRYGSDGLRVVAYVYAPRTTSAGRRRPVIVYNRGSYVAGDLAPELVPLFHRLAEAGFVVVAPMYRGSDGGEGRDEMGGADVADVRNAVRLAARLPAVDSSRIFMYGESRGGMMTFQALRDGAPVRAAVVVGAFTDLDSLVAADERSRAATYTIWPDFDRDRAAIAPPRSALRWADALRVPLLILHGGADPQVSPRHSLRLALLLDAARRPYELRVLAGGTHTLRERAAERDSLAATWFARHASRP